MTEFSGDPLLVWFALKHTRVDAASLTAIRPVFAALLIWLATRSRPGPQAGEKSLAVDIGLRRRSRWHRVGLPAQCGAGWCCTSRATLRTKIMR